MSSSWAMVLSGVLFELLLVAIALLIVYFGAETIIFAPSASSVGIAFVSTAFLLALQMPLHVIRTRYRTRFRGTAEFFEEIVLPFCASLTPLQALCISIAAGVGEEFLFRGALMPLSGMIVSSVLFAVLHFLHLAPRYPFLLLCYFAISLLFSAQYRWTQDLSCPIMTHIIYDFIVIQYYSSVGKTESHTDFPA